jgi:hypothetical protein
MIVGVDFDNTIVCYDNLFHRIALERGWIPDSLPVGKNDVRDFLRGQGRERDWTELQGYVYGPRMAEAQPFPGVREFFAGAVQRGVPVYIISHKTRNPVVGPAHDLHQTAREWLQAQGFFDPVQIGLSPGHVHFGLTRPEKVAFIKQTGCTHFVDDLEETFLEETFPHGVSKILFGRHQAPQSLRSVQPAENWSAVSGLLFRNHK